jgi:hypothetical protein
MKKQIKEFEESKKESSQNANSIYKSDLNKDLSNVLSLKKSNTLNQ